MESKVNTNNSLYTVSKVAEILKVNKNTVYDLINRKLLIGLKLGNIKVTKAEILRFLKENEGEYLSNLHNIRNFYV